MKYLVRKKVLPACLLFLLLMQTISWANAADWQNHWASAHFQNAMQQGWAQAEIANLNPESTVTRSEFLIMLEKAIKLIPGSPVAEWIKKNHVSGFEDTAAHPIATEGWMQCALDFGLVLSEEYGDNKFRPDIPITRRECMAIISRALGKVYPATHTSQVSPLFSDWDNVPEWMRGYINEMVNYKLAFGYPDGSIKTDESATMAEALALIDRSVSEMTQGLDSGIQVKIRKTNTQTEQESVAVQLTVPAQIINDKIFVSARSLYAAAAQNLYATTVPTFHWNYKDQILSFEYGVLHEFQAGNSRYGHNTGIHPYSYSFSGYPMILYGELMLPVYDQRQPDKNYVTNLFYEISWDENTKTLTIGMNNPLSPIS